MATNPDLTNPEHKDFPPSGADLRFVRRVEYQDPTHPVTKNILQRWEWSYTEGKWDWYDVPMVEDDAEST